MRTVFILLILLVGCKSRETAREECFPMIDGAVVQLQQFAFSLDTLQLDSALTLYDNAIQCDTLNTRKFSLGRYRESLTIIDNVNKVRDVPSSRNAHFFQIKGWLHEKLGNKDSAKFYFDRVKTLKGS